MRACLLALAFLGCTPISVDIDPRAAQAVKVVPEAHIEKDCSYVGPVSARFGNNFVTLDMNVENANNDLINQAHEKGITHLVMQNTQQSTNTNFGFSNNDCNNCVFMTAVGYKCGGAVAAPPPAALPPTTAAPPPAALPTTATPASATTAQPTVDPATTPPASDGGDEFWIGD